MAQKRYKAEEIIHKLREAEVELASRSRRICAACVMARGTPATAAGTPRDSPR